MQETPLSCSSTPTHVLLFSASPAALVGLVAACFVSLSHFVLLLAPAVPLGLPLPPVPPTSLIFLPYSDLRLASDLLLGGVVRSSFPPSLNLTAPLLLCLFFCRRRRLCLVVLAVYLLLPCPRYRRCASLYWLGTNASPRQRVGGLLLCLLPQPPVQSTPHDVKCCIFHRDYSPRRGRPDAAVSAESRLRLRLRFGLTGHSVRLHPRHAHFRRAIQFHIHRPVPWCQCYSRSPVSLSVCVCMFTRASVFLSIRTCACVCVRVHACARARVCVLQHAPTVTIRCLVFLSVCLFHSKGA